MNEDKAATEPIRSSLLAIPYPSADEWKRLVEEFSPEAIAHKLLLAHIPYVFRTEPLKFALFRRTIADEFGVEPSSVFIVGSAMAGRSLKGDNLDKTYEPGSDSDIDVLIVSEHLFTKYVMQSLEWVQDVSMPVFTEGKPQSQPIKSEDSKHIGWLAMAASKGIWRPDSLPGDASARFDFFEKFARVSLKTLGLQLSEDTVAKVNGRVARSFEDASSDLAASIYRLKKELRASGSEGEAGGYTFRNKRASKEDLLPTLDPS